MDLNWLGITSFPFRRSPFFRRASAKFAGRQKVHVSNKFGFTRYTKKDGIGNGTTLEL